MINHKTESESKMSIVSKTSLPWIDTDIKSDVSRPKRTRANPPVNNSLFERIAGVTMDPFWRDRMFEAKSGSFPNKISYINGVLQHKNNNDIKSIMFNMDETNPQVLSIYSLNFIEFYQSTIYMYSPMDKSKQEDAIFAVDHSEEVVYWNKLKKCQSMLILYEFAHREEKARNLNKTEYNKLVCLLNIANCLKYINNNSVTITNQLISEQSFISFDESTREYKLNEEVKIIKRNKTATRKKKSKGKVTYGQRWIEHCQSNTGGVNIRTYSYPVSSAMDDSGNLS